MVYPSTILKGLPTNAQLTITLLRIGEANNAPLPPPPRSNEAPPSKPATLDKEELSLDASHQEINEAIHADSNTDIGAPPDSPTAKKRKPGSRILSFFKSTTATGVNTKLGVDQVRAVVGSEHARNHLGILPKRGELRISGPIEFKGRHKSKKGAVYITSSAEPPCVSFSTDTEGSDTAEVKNTVFSVPITEIRELKKVRGLGWKGKIVVGWATEKEVADGLEIVGKNGEVWRVTAVTLRDGLFNRLVAMGGAGLGELLGGDGVEMEKEAV